MSYHLTITRIGLLASDAGLHFAPRLSGLELLNAFRAQADTLSRRLSQDSAEATSPEIVSVPRESYGAIEDADQDDRYQSLVASVGRIERKENIQGVEWHVRYNVSITSCSLQEEYGRSKLWLTVEGIPLSSKSGQRDEPTVLTFLKTKNEQEESYLSFMRDAYKRSLESISHRFAAQFEFGDKPIKISLTDDDSRSVAGLVDALYFDGIRSTQLRNNPDKLIRSGLNRLEHFLSFVTPDIHGPLDDKLAVESTTPAIKGVVCRYENTPHYASLVAGFARCAGDGGGYQELLDELDKDAPLSVEYMRSRSAARRLSAKLAAMEARTLAGHPRALHL